MNWPLTIIMALIGLTLLWLALRRLRQLRLKERHALLLVFAALPFILLAVWPGAIGALALWLGIDYRTLQLIGVTVFLLLVIIELLSIVGEQERKIDTLAQQIGLLMRRDARGQADDPPDPDTDDGR